MEATEQRKSEHQDYTEMMASDSAAMELLQFAIRRLNKFYRPGASPVVFTQVSKHEHRRAAPAEPPATFDDEKVKSRQKDDSDSIIGMIKLLVKDLDKEMHEAEQSENDAQKEYERMLQDSADKRAVDSKALTDKNVAKANMEADLEASRVSADLPRSRRNAASLYLLVRKYYIV